ncbi:MAG: CNNM domain-containing protein [Thermodesulfobacteriota bacterium]|nr:CNNM domain-containing protein [Thermodesulfobacteriota bacterium]
MIETNLLVISILLIVLLGFSAFFSGSETALMAINRLRLKHLAHTKPTRARLVERILKKPEKLIGTILLGNNLVNVAMSAIATALAISIWGEKGIAYVTVVLTIAILIFAEITPKIYARYFNETVSFMTAPVLNVIMFLFNPIVFFVTYLSNRILFLFGIDVSKIEKPLMSEDEILTCIKMGWSDGTITSEERKMLSRVFTLNDKTVYDVMVPRERMIIVDAESKIDDILNIILDTGHSRFPVKEGSYNNITGFIHAKDLFQLMKMKKASSIKEAIRPAYFVPATKKIDKQLRSFQARKLHQAIVQEADGTIAGLITLEDILEELVGSIQDEHDV